MDEEPSCALRALNLCDGRQVVDIDRALAQGDGHCRCYCATLYGQAGEELAQAVRIARARTVARATEIQRRIDAHRSRLGRAAAGPPF